MSLMMLLQLGVVLGIMVLVHEFGHFAVAKLCGVRVEVFSIGFGKRLCGFKRGDTDYRLSILPLGGYVKMAGDIPGEDPTGDPGEFNAHPRWQRALIALAGPLANFILAFLLMLGVYMYHHEVEQYDRGSATVEYVPAGTPVARTGIHAGDTILHFDNSDNPDWEAVFNRAQLNPHGWVAFSYLNNGHRYDTQLQIASEPSSSLFFSDLGFVPHMTNTPLVVDDVVAGQPADRAGLRVGDKVISIDGLRLYSLSSVISYMQDQKGKPATMLVQRDGRQFPLQVTPELMDGETGKAYRIGFKSMPPPSRVESLPLGQASVAAWQFCKENSLMIVEVVKRLFTRQVSMRSLAGPLGIGEQIHEAAQISLSLVFATMAIISINLGILNLMPFPILDGGMLTFLLIEGILRRDVNVVVKERVYQVAFVCLILFAAVIFYNDLTRISIFPHVKP